MSKIAKGDVNGVVLVECLGANIDLELLMNSLATHRYVAVQEIPMALSTRFQLQTMQQSPSTYATIVASMFDGMILVCNCCTGVTGESCSKDSFISEFCMRLAAEGRCKCHMVHQSEVYSNLEFVEGLIKKLKTSMHDKLSGLLPQVPRPIGRDFNSRQEYAECIAQIVIERNSLVYRLDAPPGNSLPNFQLTEDLQREEVDSLEMTRLILLGRPFVVSGCKSSITSFSQLVEVCGAEQQVSVRKGQSENGYDGMMEASVKLCDYVSETGPHGKLQGYYAANNPLPLPLAKVLGTPAQFLNYLEPVAHAFLLPDAKFWVGGSGAAAPLHRDLQDNVVWCLFGRKRFWLVAPEGFENNDQPPTNVTQFLQSAPGTLEDVDPNAAIYQVDLEHGDMLWLPTGWWHTTLNLTEATCTVNYWMSAVFMGCGVALPDLKLFPRWSEMVNQLIESK